MRILDQLVYFIRAKTTGAIKIGVAEEPKRRLRQLQTGHHETLELLGTSRGGQEREAQLHKQFASQHIRGEWFRPSPELLACIGSPEDAEALYAEIGEAGGMDRNAVIGLRLDQARKRLLA